MRERDRKRVSFKEFKVFLKYLKKKKCCAPTKLLYTIIYILLEFERKYRSERERERNGKKMRTEFLKTRTEDSGLSELSKVIYTTT